MNKLTKKWNNIFTKVKRCDILEAVNLRKSIQRISGDYYMEEIPVPIPNTEVKLQCAEDICGLPC